MMAGIRFAEIKIDEDIICDGHHRYLASLLANYTLATIPAVRTVATKVINWNLVVFDEEDWDTLARIKFLNEQDADYNNMPFEKLVELLG